MRVGHLLFPLFFILVLTCFLVIAGQYKEDWELLEQQNEFIKKAQKFYSLNFNQNQPKVSKIKFSIDSNSVVIKREVEVPGVLNIYYIKNGISIAKEEWFNESRKGLRTHYHHKNGKVFAKVKFEGRSFKVILFVGASGEIIGAHKDSFPMIPFIIYY